MTELPDWMKPMDRRILEFLTQTERVKVGGLWFKPAGIAINVGADRKYVNKRLIQLAENDYLDRSEDGFYRITEEGSQLVRKF